MIQTGSEWSPGSRPRSTIPPMDAHASPRQVDDPGAVFPTTRLFGLDFANGGGVEPIVDGLFDGRELRPDSWRCVVTPNVDHLIRYRKHADEAEAATHATVVMPDGMPIIWASRLLGRPLASRLA